ncbi:hypothetical protein ACLVWU_12920 [Bdellovibrio sp. HCB290]|uniref:hypothetical protein n=1 Tax=Bdellovibrio sp. HCB290 TaxID=3394356 RepID=UPI0039B3E0B6
MKKIIATIAMVLVSQAALAEVDFYGGTLHIVVASEEGAFAAITGDLAHVMHKNLKAKVEVGDAKGNDHFLCGTASVGMSCVTGFKDITSMEKTDIPVVAIFDDEEAAGLVMFDGEAAVKVWNGMAKIEEMDSEELGSGVKIGNEFLCFKAEKVEESACGLLIDVNGKVSAPSINQMKANSLKLQTLK